MYENASSKSRPAWPIAQRRSTSPTPTRQRTMIKGTRRYHPSPMADTARESENVDFSPAALVLVLVIVLMPFPGILVKFTSGDLGYAFQAILFPSDLPLAVLTIAMVPYAIRRMRERSFGVLPWLALGLTAWMALAYVFNPSGRGVADVLRLLGIVAMIVAFLELRSRPERGIVLTAIAGVAIFQTAVSVLQIATRSSVG